MGLKPDIARSVMAPPSYRFRSALLLRYWSITSAKGRPTVWYGNPAIFRRGLRGAAHTGEL
ncbi:hypothetical protein ARTHRO9AX_220233 [Arthrobacter sp. 9AX]|nr:hypothetical protein ARTHRO9AX_220233 [Arthrobacter sp. 9AX]